jgi:aryl-alcohol dehydrogenase-like predicted oxidoreductase
MTLFERALPTTRRRMLQLLALLGVGGRELVDATAALAESEQRAADVWPEMTYRTLGRTGFNGSRLVFGCGAALMFRAKDGLLNEAFAHGVNVFDVGTSHYYRNAESNLADFAKKNRDQMFLISKGLVGIDLAPGDELTSQQHQTAARNWTKALDRSLADLKTDHVDAYYVMAVNNVSLIRSDAMHEAFLAAKKAGKVDHWGVSTHQNAQAVLAAAAESGRYSLAQIAITPAGWYDWSEKAILANSQPMAGLRPTLDKARAAGIGLIGMKAGRYLAGALMGFGPDRPTAFDAHYDPKFLQAPLSPFQRSYAYVLAHGLDAVNADSQSLAHLRENFTAAATSQRYFA